MSMMATEDHLGRKGENGSAVAAAMSQLIETAIFMLIFILGALAQTREIMK